MRSMHGLQRGSQVRRVRPDDGAAAGVNLDAAVRERDAATLVEAYRREADRLEARGEGDAAYFYVTQAYIWALDAGLPDADVLRARLVAGGREE